MRPAAALILSFLLCVESGMAAGPDSTPLQLTWEELAPRITHKKVAFALPDGTRVEGRVLSVEADGLRMKVSKTSNRHSQPKGKQTIARRNLSLIRVTEYRKRGRIIGTLGAAGAAAGISAASYPDIYEGPLLIAIPAVIAAGIAGAAVGGYFIGKAFDKHVTDIRINGAAPANPPAPPR